MLFLFVACSAQMMTPSVEDIRITWLGVTSFMVQYDDKNILLDPFFSRPKLGEEEGSSLQGKNDFYNMMSRLEIDSLDAILVGHAHYDHAIDVGMVSMEMDAPIYASSTTCWIAKSQGVDPQTCHEVTQGEEYTLGSLNVRVGRSIHWWPEQDGIGGAYGVLEEEPDPEHLFIVPHGGVLSFLLTFTEEKGSPSILFQDTLGPIDADDGSGSDYIENLRLFMDGQHPPNLWMTCIDCANSKEEFQPYMQQIQPQNIFSMHFDGLNPDIGDGLQESFQEPDWFPTLLEEFDAESLYPERYFQSYTVSDDGIIEVE